MLLLRFIHSLSVTKSFQVVSFRFYNSILKMSDTNIAYFHQQEGSDRFKVTFNYINEEIKVRRQFNFDRCTDETVENLLSRVSTNLGKTVSKKLKKKRKIGDSEEDEQSCKLSIELISSENAEIPNSSTCKETFFSNKYSPGTLILRIIGLDYVVAVNSPWIDSMKLPDCIMAGFPLYPSSIQAKFTEKSLSTFVWMRSHKNTEMPSTAQSKDESLTWTVIGEGFMYIPAVADIGHKLKLKCTPKNNTSIGPPYESESSSLVEAGPGLCPFEERHLYTQDKTCIGSFRVVSYNILADVYSSTDTAQNELFNYCPTYALNIDYRKQLFLKELLGYNADLLCLQEVDMKVFESDLVPILSEQGLVGIHTKKSTIREGVCSFYSPEKFKLLDVEETVLSQELLNKSYCSHILDCVNTNSQLKERITGLGTAAQAVTLESLEKPGELLVVGNTHFYFHPDSDHIRLLQSGIFMAFLTNVVKTTKEKNPEHTVSLLICGDFNSVPECGIYRLMTTKHVPEDIVDWKSKPEEEVKGLSLSQPFNMESACGTPPYTNYTVSFAACLDYIFFQTDRLKVEAVVPLPSDDVLREHRAIPSVVFPSDHVALVSELRWTT